MVALGMFSFAWQIRAFPTSRWTVAAMNENRIPLSTVLGSSPGLSGAHDNERMRGHCRFAIESAGSTYPQRALVDLEVASAGRDPAADLNWTRSLMLDDLISTPSWHNWAPYHDRAPFSCTSIKNEKGTTSTSLLRGYHSYLLAALSARPHINRAVTSSLPALYARSSGTRSL